MFYIQLWELDSATMESHFRAAELKSLIYCVNEYFICAVLNDSFLRLFEYYVSRVWTFHVDHS